MAENIAKAVYEDLIRRYADLVSPDQWSDVEELLEAAKGSRDTRAHWDVVQTLNWALLHPLADLARQRAKEEGGRFSDKLAELEDAISGFEAVQDRRAKDGAAKQGVLAARHIIEAPDPGDDYLESVVRRMATNLLFWLNDPVSYQEREEMARKALAYAYPEKPDLDLVKEAADQALRDMARTIMSTVVAGRVYTTKEGAKIGLPRIVWTVHELDEKARQFRTRFPEQVTKLREASKDCAGYNNHLGALEYLAKAIIRMREWLENAERMVQSARVSSAGESDIEEQPAEEAEVEPEQPASPNGRMKGADQAIAGLQKRTEKRGDHGPLHRAGEKSAKQVAEPA